MVNMMNDELFKNFTISCNHAIGTTQSYELSLRKYCIYFDMSLKELLEEYLPDYIIVWGKRLYGGLPNWNGESSILQINEKAKTDVWTYNIKGKRIPAIKVHHPSSPSGKRWIYWHEFYKEFLHL